MISCESHGEQIKCKSVVPAKGGDHPEMAKGHKLKENQVKSKSVVFPKGGDVDAINRNNQDTLKTIIVQLRTQVEDTLNLRLWVGICNEQETLRN